MQVAAGLVLDAVGDVHLVTADERMAGVADLAAHLRVERRRVKHEKGVLLGLHHVEQLGVRSVGGVDLVTGELRRLGLRVALGGSNDDVGLARSTTALALLRH